MRFLVDAHLPRGICRILRTAGHDAIHTEDLPAQNETKDSALNELSLRENRVVISKDTDFYHSLLLQGRPWKLILVCTGNLRSRDLKALFERSITEIAEALIHCDLVEIYREGVRPRKIP